MSPIFKYALVAAIAFMIGYAIRTPVTDIDATPPEPRSTSTAHTRSGEPPSLPIKALAQEFEREKRPKPIARLEEAETIRGFLLDEFKSGKGWVSFDIFDAEGNITDAFAAMYGLSDAEIETLQSKAKAIDEKLFRIAQANSTVSVKEDGSLRVALKPFEGAEHLYSNILDDFKETLGNERFSDFLELGESSLGETFHQFGGENLEVRISSSQRETMDGNGRAVTETIYEITEKSERAGQSSARTLYDIPEDRFANEFRLVKRLIESKAPTR